MTDDGDGVVGDMLGQDLAGILQCHVNRTKGFYSSSCYFGRHFQLFLALFLALLNYVAKNKTKLNQGNLEIWWFNTLKLTCCAF